MRVLYISPNGFMGGAERFVYNCALGHDLNHIKPLFLFLNEGACFEAVRKIHPKNTFLLPFKLKLSRPHLLLKAVLYIRKLIKKESIEIVHATMPYSHILSYLSTLFLDIKRVWFQHGPVGGTLDKIAVTLPVHRILFNSAYLQNIHNSLLCANRNIHKQEIVHLGIEEFFVNDQEVQILKEKYNTNDKRIILSMGRICFWKGQLNVIKGLHKLIESGQVKKSDFTLCLLGKPNSDNDKEYDTLLRRYVEDNNLQSLVKFVGHTDNPQNYFKMADIFIHSSTIPEPFGLVAAEAMMNRCFVIGSSEGGIKDILKNEVTGLTYDSTTSNPSENLGKLLMKYHELIFSRQSKQKNNIIENAYKLITNDYSLKKMTDHLEKIYKEEIQ